MSRYGKIALAISFSAVLLLALNFRRQSTSNRSEGSERVPGVGQGRFDSHRNPAEPVKSANVSRRILVPFSTNETDTALIVPLSTETNAAAKTKKAPKEKVLQDPLARDALAMVGADSEAEMYWFDAIHNPALPKSERQDLIDDLNEEGLADPKHPTVEEIPLLLSRLEVLENLGPTLDEQFDWHESYNDILNLVDLAIGGGKPVQ